MSVRMFQFIFLFSHYHHLHNHHQILQNCKAHRQHCLLLSYRLIIHVVFPDILAAFLPYLLKFLLTHFTISRSYHWDYNQRLIPLLHLFLNYDQAAH